MILSTISGCDDGSARMAREAADRQAEQNRTMATLQETVAAGTRDLVAGEAAAREQNLALQRDLQSQRAVIADQHNELERERRAIAGQRRTESVWAAILPATGGVILVIAALAFAWLVLYGLTREDDSATTSCELLVDYLVDESRIPHVAAEQPQLPPPSAVALPQADPLPEQDL